ncbi:MAG: glycosyltransferase [Phycisphaerae bacterium]|nr:glycosyltransferase [Phycisphaerae bacterium]
MDMPFVSVMMITYNHAPYIRRAIEGVLSQETRFCFELVVGEDRSTDGTGEIVRDYEKKHPGVIRVVTSDANVGMRRNYYRTAGMCRGKYIAFCEGDDYWQRRDKLQRQVDYLEEHPECGLVHSEHDRYYAHLDQTIRSYFRTSGNVPPREFNVFTGWGAHIQTCTVMARHDLVREIHSDPAIYGHADAIGGVDIPLFIEVGMRSKIGYIDESLATYTVHNESASHTPNRIRKARFCKCNIESYLYLAKKYHREEERLRLEQAWRRAALWLAFLERDRTLAETAIAGQDRRPWKAKMLYWGARSPVGHRVLKVLDGGYRRIRDCMDERRLARWVERGGSNPCREG